MPYNSNFSLEGNPGPTVQMTSTDAAQMIDPKILKMGDDPAMGALITVDTNAIRFTLGETNPGQSFGHYLAAGQSYRMSSPQTVQSFKFCSAQAGTAAVIFVTPLF